MNTYNDNQYWAMFHKMNYYKKISSTDLGVIKNDYLYGRISNINLTKRFGWIGNNIYFSDSNILVNFDKLKVGDLVEFINIEPINPKKRKGQAKIINIVNTEQIIQKTNNTPKTDINSSENNTKKPCLFCNQSTMRANKNKMLGHLGALKEGNVKNPCEKLKKFYNKEFKDLSIEEKIDIIKRVDELYK